MIVTFDEIKNKTEKFVREHKELLPNIDIIVGISRGGLIPAAILAAAIDKPLAAAYINKNDEIFFDRLDWTEGKKILIVDDVVRSGKTLWLLRNHLVKHAKPAGISAFALFRVPSLGNNSYTVSVIAEEVEHDVIFPWDYDRE